MAKEPRENGAEKSCLTWCFPLALPSMASRASHDSSSEMLPQGTVGLWERKKKGNQDCWQDPHYHFHSLGLFVLSSLYNSDDRTKHWHPLGSHPAESEKWAWRERSRVKCDSKDTKSLNDVTPTSRSQAESVYHVAWVLLVQTIESFEEDVICRDDRKNENLNL